ncbi:SEL1-like repeat protein [Nocardia veterana]|uniref:Tetratricopeptide/SEL1-like repeat protein n=1 Tax=Nocardia veterana TaxID=132249 RepID=A0A7X6RJF7_9NOCA|nr:tetratricopeptide/SEL1-like repeat protein [Nocardia veterana]NKY88160.1 tetratricopeptide/SEL1-like repeat protein [Nocardia veterana]
MTSSTEKAEARDMNPHEVIALAVTAGAAGDADTTAPAVAEAYRVLRDRITRDYPGVDPISVEHAAASDAERSALAASLERHGAGEDAELLAAAEKFIATAVSSPALDRTHAILSEVVLGGSEELLGTDHPDTLAIRHELARTYHSIGQLDRAIAHFEATLTAREQVNGPTDPLTLETRIGLADCYRDAGRIDDLIPLDSAVLAARTQHLGHAHPDTVAARDRLAEDYEAAGMFAEAIEMRAANLRARREALGPDHPETLVTYRHIARAYEAAGRIEDAVTAYETALAEYERALGRDHVHTSVVRYSLARAYSSAGRPDDSITCHTAAIDDYTRIAGPDHPDPHVMRASLGQVLESVGRIEEARAAYAETAAAYARLLEPDSTALLNVRIDYARTTVSQLENTLGPDHPNTLDARGDLATALQAAGRTEDAIAECEQALSRAGDIHGAQHDTTGRLGALLAEFARTDSDTPVTDHGSDRGNHRQQPDDSDHPVEGRDHPVEATELRERARHAEQTGRAAEAEELFRQAFEAGDPVAAHDLGMLLATRGDDAGAEEWVRRAAELGVPDSAFELGCLEQRRNDLIAAEHWYRRAADNGHRDSLLNLGILRQDRGDHAEAIACFTRAWEMGADKAAFNLGRLYDDGGDPESATIWYGRAAERGNGGAAFNLGFVRQDLGDSEGHLAAWRRAAECLHPRAAYALGVVHRDRGDITAAIHWFRRAVTEVGSEEAASQLTDLYRQRGENAKAAFWGEFIDGLSNFSVEFDRFAATTSAAAIHRQNILNATLDHGDVIFDGTGRKLTVGPTDYDGVTVLGSYSHSTRTWLWAWANPNFTPDHPAVEPLRRIREYGELHDIPEFTVGRLDLSRFRDPHQAASTMAIAAAALLEGNGVKSCRINDGQGSAYYHLDDPRLPADEFDPVAAPRLLLTATEVFPADHRRVVRGFLSHYGMTPDETPDSITALSPQGHRIAIAFTSDGLISTISCG